MAKATEKLYENSLDMRIDSAVNKSVDTAIVDKVIPAILKHGVEQKEIYNGKIDKVERALSLLSDAQTKSDKKFDAYVTADTLNNEEEIKHRIEDRKVMDGLKTSVDALITFQTTVKPIVAFRDNLKGFGVISEGTLSFVLKVATVAGALLFIKKLF